MRVMIKKNPPHQNYRITTSPHRLLLQKVTAVTSCERRTQQCQPSSMEHRVT